MAPRRKAIDGTMVRKLAALDCSIAEIAATLECSRDLLERRFRKELTEGREQGKSTLRRKQWEVAMGTPADPGQPATNDAPAIPPRPAIPPSVTMLIFLGKQRLGQADKTETINANLNAVDQFLIARAQARKNGASG